MKAGETIEVRLMHPVYAGGKLVIAENTPLRGRVVELEPDSKTRLHARLRGDFTPFRTARVQFDELMLPSGALQISAATAADGAPVLQLQAPGVSPNQSFISRRWTEAKQQLHDRIAYFTAPGKGDRALQLLYHQLPYHPQRIDAHTAWSFELTAPVELPTTPIVASDPPAPAAATPGKSEIWSVNATLTRASAPRPPGPATLLKPRSSNPSTITTSSWSSRKALHWSARFPSPLPRNPSPETGSSASPSSRSSSLRATTAQSKEPSPEPPPRKLRISHSMPKARSRRATNPV
jgi:hypothetical protein